jgi:pimeloyl-ACP methyl ester carboxylesterase
LRLDVVCEKSKAFLVFLDFELSLFMFFGSLLLMFRGLRPKRLALDRFRLGRRTTEPSLLRQSCSHYNRMNSRLKLTVSLLILILVSIAFQTNTAQNQTSAPPAKPVFVIVHGAWGGSWAFRKVDSLLREKGAVVYRPSLTGLGERVHLASPSVGLSTHIEDVVNTILFEDLHDIVLVGHSYGGMVITGVADRVPDRIRKLIYLDAFVPNDGESVLSLTGARGDWIKSMIRGDYIVPPWVKPEQPLPKDVPQPLKTFTEPIVLKNKSATQLAATYILTVEAGHPAKNDDFASQAERAKMRGWTINQLTSDHNPQWSAPEALVEMLYQNR